MTSPLTRAASLIVRPRATWATIASEDTSFVAMLFGYVVPLAAIGPVATFFALRVVGIPIAARQIYRTSAGVAFANAALAFVLVLGGIVLIATLIAMLAPPFGAARDFVRAFRISAYAYTPLLLGGGLVLVPRLGMWELGALQLLAGADALVLLVMGLIAIIGASPRRALVFAVVVVTAAFGCGYLFGVAAALVRGPIA